MTEDEMVGWHHQLNRHDFEQTPGVVIESSPLALQLTGSYMGW